MALPKTERWLNLSNHTHVPKGFRHPERVKCVKGSSQVSIFNSCRRTRHSIASQCRGSLHSGYALGRDDCAFGWLLRRCAESRCVDMRCITGGKNDAHTTPLCKPKAPDPRIGMANSFGQQPQTAPQNHHDAYCSRIVVASMQDYHKAFYSGFVWIL